MHYYLISFFYHGPCCGAAGPGQEDSQALGAAINQIDEIIVAKQLDTHQAYAWPDGSLYYYLRSPEPLSREEIQALFHDDAIWVVSATEQSDYQKLDPISYATLEEKFSLSREGLSTRIRRRQKERDSLFQKYYQHRDNCSECKSGFPPCNKGLQEHLDAIAAEEAWRQAPRELKSGLPLSTS